MGEGSFGKVFLIRNIHTCNLPLLNKNRRIIRNEKILLLLPEKKRKRCQSTTISSYPTKLKSQMYFCTIIKNRHPQIHHLYNNQWRLNLFIIRTMQERQFRKRQECHYWKWWKSFFRLYFVLISLRVEVLETCQCCA